MVEQWALQRGATVVAGGGVRFSVWAPSAERVAVRLRSSGGEREYPLESHRMGVFEGTVREARAGDDYRYVLAGPKGTPDKALPDPVSRFQPEGVHGPSRVVDPAAFRWTDDGWSGLEMPEYVIYELHVGTFSDAGTFDGAIEHLAGLRDLGVTAIEIMPVAQFPGARNWGYDGVLPYAVQDSSGGPEGLRRLVDAAHATGLAVVLDVVYNHFGPEGNYLGGYGPYFTDTYKTPWGPALNYDGRDSDEVRRYFIDNALYWITEFHMDALRLDAIHGIFDFGARHVLRDIADAVRAQGIALGRHAIVIGESDLNDPKVVRSAAEHGFGMDAQWADDLHHAIHSVLTGETNGYYADFGGVRPVAQSLGTPFYYAGTYSAHRRRRHGAPATGLPLDRFVVSVQNHDQVGNRATGSSSRRRCCSCRPTCRCSSWARSMARRIRSSTSSATATKSCWTRCAKDARRSSRPSAGATRSPIPAPRRASSARDSTAASSRTRVTRRCAAFTTTSCAAEATSPRSGPARPTSRCATPTARTR
jgi:maltooligosyltrehalose trehalohydrolase